MKVILIGIAFTVEVCCWNADKHRLLKTEQAVILKCHLEKQGICEREVENNECADCEKKRNYLEQSIQNNTSSKTESIPLAEQSKHLQRTWIMQCVDHRATFPQHSTYRPTRYANGQLHLLWLLGRAFFGGLIVVERNIRYVFIFCQINCMTIIEPEQL